MRTAQHSARVLPMREPPAPAPEPGTYFVQFQKQLAASEHIAHLANVLANVSWLHEGWTGLDLPLRGELKRIYERAACYAVRFCSDVERKVAVSRAERWGVSTFSQLQEQLRSCDTTPAEGERLIRQFIRQCCDVERHALMHGINDLSPQERVLLADESLWTEDDGA